MIHAHFFIFQNEILDFEFEPNSHQKLAWIDKFVELDIYCYTFTFFDSHLHCTRGTSFPNMNYPLEQNSNYHIELKTI